MAHIIAPRRTPRIGLVAVAINCWKAGRSFRTDMASFIVSSPKNNRPKPKMTCPICFREFFLEKSISMAPIKMQNGASREASSAIRILVIVVPIFAPRITPVACARSMMPALIIPMVITVVAEDDWITAVTSIPSRKPRTGLRVSFSIRSFILAPAARCRPSPM